MTVDPQALPPTTVDSLREELVRVRAELSEYVGHEPTVREEMHHLGDENRRLRQIAAYLLLEYAEKSTVDLWDEDIDGYTDRIEIEPSPDRRDSTRLTYTRGTPLRLSARKPIDHRAEAEKHASQASFVKSDRQHHPIDPIASDYHLRMAMVHATLANGETGTATAADMRDALTLLRRREHAVREAVSAHIADGLTGTNRDRWGAARSLAQALDAADANVDNDVDGYLTDKDHDPRKAWAGSHLPAEPDPWAAKAATEKADESWAPDPGVQKIQNFYRITSAHLADMLLDPDELGSKEWARRLTFALENEGIDLTDAIRSRINDTTLGRNPSEPPF